jgi:hypothetical protein
LTTAEILQTKQRLLGGLEMSDSNDPSPKEPQPAEQLLKPLSELFKSDSHSKDDDPRKVLDRRAIWAILATGVVAAIKLAGGMPFISWSATPLAGISFSILISAVQERLRNKQPSTIFYLCPEEQKFIPIKHSSLPKYRKMKSCSCGCQLIKKCQQGKHEILSPDPNNADTPPSIDGFCQFCDPAIPKPQRAYLPETARKSDNEPSRMATGKNK